MAHWSQRQQVAEPEFKARFVDSKIYTIFIMLYQHDLQMFKKYLFCSAFYFGIIIKKSHKKIIQHFYTSFTQLPLTFIVHNHGTNITGLTLDFCRLHTEQGLIEVQT